MLDGGEGDDADQASAAKGTDTASYAGRGSRVRRSTCRGSRTQDTHGAGWDHAACWSRHLVGSAFGGDVLIGDALANRLTGGGGNDILAGGDGADVFAYGAVLDSTAAVAT